MEYSIINKDEMGRALLDIMPEFKSLDEVKRSQLIDKVAEMLGSRHTLSMLLQMCKREVLKNN